jgi:hypothetical protein
LEHVLIEAGIKLVILLIIYYLNLNIFQVNTNSEAVIEPLITNSEIVIEPLKNNYIEQMDEIKIKIYNKTTKNPEDVDYDVDEVIDMRTRLGKLQLLIKFSDINGKNFKP